MLQCPWQGDPGKTCVSAGQSWHSSSSYSRGSVSPSGPFFVPAHSFFLLIGPEKTFRVMGSCCFQSPGEDGAVILMPSCVIM